MRWLRADMVAYARRKGLRPTRTADRAEVLVSSDDTHGYDDPRTLTHRDAVQHGLPIISESDFFTTIASWPDVPAIAAKPRMRPARTNALLKQLPPLDSPCSMAF